MGLNLYDSLGRRRFLQLVGLGDRKKFVETVQPREIITFASVEKSPLPDIDIEEAQEWAKRQPLCEALDPAALGDTRVLKLGSVRVASATATRASQLE